LSQWVGPEVGKRGNRAINRGHKSVPNQGQGDKGSHLFIQTMVQGDEISSTTTPCSGLQKSGRKSDEARYPATVIPVT